MGIVSSVLIARMIGPEGRGIYAKILLITLLLNEFSSVGFYKSLTYHCAKDPDYSRNYFNSFLKFCLPFSIIVCVISYILYGYILDSETEIFYFRIALIYIIFYVLFHSTSHVLHGLDQFNIWNIFRFIQTFLWMLIIIFSFYFISDQFNFKLLIVIYIFNHALFSTIYFFIYNKKAPLKKNLFDEKRKNSFLKYNFKNFILKISEKIFNEFDLIIVVFLFDDITIGVYAVSKSIALLSIPLFSSFSEKTFQNMSKKFNFKALLSSLRILTVLSSFGYFLFYIFGEYFVIKLYGNEFKQVFSITLYLLINYIFTGFIIYSFDVFRSLQIFFKPTILIISLLSIFLTTLIYFDISDLFIIIKLLIFNNVIIIISISLLFYYEKNKNPHRLS